MNGKQGDSSTDQTYLLSENRRLQSIIDQYANYYSTYGSQSIQQQPQQQTLQSSQPQPQEAQ